MRTLVMMSLALMLAACAHTPPQATTPTPLALAPPDAPGVRNASQVIHAVYGAHAVILRTAIEIDPGLLKVVGVSATGQRLFTASWDGKAISADKSAFVPGEIAPENVLADMQLALWPLVTVQPMFAQSGREVSEPFAGVRRLHRGEKLLAEVHYASADPWNGRLWLVNFEFGYSLTIDTTTSAPN